MPLASVIEELNVLRDLTPSLFSRVVAQVVQQLILQHPSETLHRRVVVAVASPTNEFEALAVDI